MTEKQIERIKLKIDKYKKALARDKKMWGGQLHDGQGIRYAIPAEYIKLKDYKSGLRYLKWFDKYFPDDYAYAVFWFEVTFILFKCGKLKEAEEKAHRTFFSNTYLFDKFLEKEKETFQFDKDEDVDPDWERESLAKHFLYLKTDAEFVDFAIWVETILQSKTFLDKVNEFIELEQRLKKEPVGKKRSELVDRHSKIVYG